MVAEKSVGKLTFENLTKVFTNEESEVYALNNVNAEINPGEFVSLIGPSGCGKSTLLRLIAGLETPTVGTAKLDDVVIEKPGCDRGLVFQDPTLFPWLTIEKNVSYGLKARKVFKDHKQDVNEFIELVGLNGFEKSYPHQLSGGMAQRASLARALVNNPKVLLLDEPLGALDAFTRMNMQDELLRIWHERHTTMVMVTHDVDEAIYLSDKIYVMTPRPAKIAKIVPVEIGRNRTHGRKRDSKDFMDLRSEILRILDFTGYEENIEYFI